MRDLRKYSKQTLTRVIIGALLILLIVGEGAIYVIYGPGGAGMGLLCIAAGLLPILLILLFFWIIERILKNAQHN